MISIPFIDVGGITVFCDKNIFSLPHYSH